MSSPSLRRRPQSAAFAHSTSRTLPRLPTHSRPPPSEQTTPLPTPLSLPQEEGNIPYVVDNGVGAFETDPSRIADIMADWLGDAPAKKEAFKEMARRSKALGRPRAVYNIARDLAGLVEAAPRLVVEEAAACCGGRRRQPALAAA